MLPTRLLPPRFLVPAWTAAQLRQVVVQRAYKSTISKPEKSLFEELFPEESKKLQKNQELDFRGVGKDDKFPPFKWDVNEQRPVNLEAREKRSIGSYSPMKLGIPEPKKSPKRALHGGGPRKHEKESDAYFNLLEVQRRSATVVILGCASKTLEESDFFRLGKQGEHIEGWTNGIIKVIPGRNPSTLEPLGHYFVLFESIPAANAYIDQLQRLHKISQMGTSAWTMPLPSELRRGEEDIRASLQGFTLIPASFNQVVNHTISQPYRASILKMLTDGGPSLMAGRKNKAEDKVLFSLSEDEILPRELRNALVQDGSRRNLQWELAGGERELVQLHGESGAEKAEYARSVFSPLQEMHDTLKASRYLISFKNRHEARRFVREWHRRPLPAGARSRNLPGQAPPIVHAEILW